MLCETALPLVLVWALDMEVLAVLAVPAAVAACTSKSAHDPVWRRWRSPEYKNASLDPRIRRCLSLFSPGFSGSNVTPSFVRSVGLPPRFSVPANLLLLLSTLCLHASVSG
ncbi:hypothetical protein V8C26DRAFT_272920 [Trichoderma gracile]